MDPWLIAQCALGITLPPSACAAVNSVLTSGESPAAAVADNLHDLEAQAIDQVLAVCRGNMAAAARKLGISRSTLYRQLEARQPPPGE